MLCTNLLRLDDDTVTGSIFLTCQFHPGLRHKRGQQGIQAPHDIVVASYLVQPMLLDLTDTLYLDITGHDTREGATQIGGCRRAALRPGDGERLALDARF